MLEPILQSSVAASPYDSDHNPILTTLLGAEEEDVHVYYTSQFKTEAVAGSRAWRLNPEEMFLSAEELEDIYARFKEASGVAIPEIIHGKFYPKPYWTNELKVSRRNREKLYQKFSRTKSIQNLINWKRVRAEHRKLNKTVGEPLHPLLGNQHQ